MKYKTLFSKKKSTRNFLNHRCEREITLKWFGLSKDQHIG